MRAIFDVSRWNTFYFRQSYWPQNIFETIFRAFYPNFYTPLRIYLIPNWWAAILISIFRKKRRQIWWIYKSDDRKKSTSAPCRLTTPLLLLLPLKSNTHLSSSRIIFPHSNAVLKTDEWRERVAQTHLSPHISIKFSIDIFYTIWTAKRNKSQSQNGLCQMIINLSFLVIEWILYISTPPQSPK